MKRSNKKAKKILIVGMIMGALAGILITFLAANQKMHQKNDEMKEMQTKYEEQQSKLEAQIKEIQEESQKEKTLPTDWNLVLVNESYPLDTNYQPELTTVDEKGNAVDSRIAESLNKMLEDANKAGLNPQIVSSYRSYDNQKTVFNQTMQGWLNQGYGYIDAYNETKKSVAVPGISEHATGLALDIVSPDYSELDEKQAETKEQKWLMENCQNYGFILRYPQDKSDITNIIYEPWHYRYVGEEAATEIMEKALTLEEYLGQA